MSAVGLCCICGRLLPRRIVGLRAWWGGGGGCPQADSREGCVCVCVLFKPSAPSPPVEMIIARVGAIYSSYQSALIPLTLSFVCMHWCVSLTERVRHTERETDGRGGGRRGREKKNCTRYHGPFQLNHLITTQREQRGKRG